MTKEQLSQFVGEVNTTLSQHGIAIIEIKVTAEKQRTDAVAQNIAVSDRMRGIEVKLAAWSAVGGVIAGLTMRLIEKIK